MNRLNDLLELVFWLIKKFRRPISIYIVVSKNSMTVNNLDNGKSASENSGIQFSSQRLLIADPLEAEKVASNLLLQVSSFSQFKD